VASTGEARTFERQAAAAERRPAAAQAWAPVVAARLRPALIPAASIAGLILLWQLAALIADDPRRLPAPGAVLHAIVLYTASGELPYHLGITLLRVAASFVIAMAIGTAIGLAMGRAPLFDRIAHPWLVFLLNIPALVTIVLAYIWIGLVESALIFAVAINKIPNAVVTVREGARALDRSLLEMAAVFRIGRRRTLTHVVLPQLYPYLAAAARSGLALIWKIVLVTELLGRSSGVGFEIGLHFQNFDVTGILAYAIAFVAIIQIIEWTVLLPLERHVSRWRR
jgi:NitT/TauT family transport system permease protein